MSIIVNVDVMMAKRKMSSNELAEKASLLCQAEIVQVCNDAIKGSLLSGESVTEDMISALLGERLGVYKVDQKVS